MITSEVSKEQLQKWENLCKEKASALRPNRISGKELDEYFRKTYRAEPVDFPELAEAIRQSTDDASGGASEIRTYCLDHEIYIGIDIKSGYFQVECENIEKCIPIYDDLFVARGLDENDLQNYVLTGQYIELSGI